MGNSCFYSCSPCQGQNKFSMDILVAVEGMQHVDDLVGYIDELMIQIDRGEQEQLSKPITVASSIKFGGDLMEKFSKRPNRHVCKKCLLSTLDRQARKVVFDVVNQAKHIQCVGIALSIIAHLLEQAEQVSSNKDQCLHLLRYISALSKHMKNLDIHLDRAKLDKILHFIVKGTFICALQMKPNILCRFISAPVDDDDLKNLESQLVYSYRDLEFEALTSILNRLPIVPNPSQGEYPHDAVGIEEAQNKVIGLLDLNDSSCRVVIIYGIGGIGKTTLATAVFNSLDLSGYDYCRVDLDQDSRHTDLPPIQHQVLRDVFKENLKLNNCTQGREKMSEAFAKASKPVFLFIDNALRQIDLDMLLPVTHLSRLPLRSRILVTTRNLNETEIFRHQDGIQVYSHRVDSLSEPEAKRLLCQYALGDGNRSFDPDVNMDGILQICGRIPLVLIIVGSELNRLGNTASACNEILEYHKEWREKGFEGGEEHLTERMVDFVYRRLKEPSKEAFLDIVFFFCDWERRKVGDIVGEVQLQDLERAALVTISEEDKVNIHDIVRARGRKLSEGNRITDRETWSILLSDAQKLQQIKGIWLRKTTYDYQIVIDDDDDNDELSLEPKHLDFMSRSLRVLSLGKRTTVNGRCERVFKDLRFLHIWYQEMLPIDISKSRQLVFFHGRRISEAQFTINLPKSLRLLYLDGSRWGSRVSIDLNEHLTSLRELKLFNITLANFEIGISELKSLRFLHLSGCEGFTSVPESLGNFYCLKILKLDDCFKLERLPESFGNLFNMQNLDMGRCFMLERLPESFGNLSSLQILDMNNCSKLERLPDTFGNLSSLQRLYMIGCSMLKRLPDSFGSLSSLQYLDMSRCSMLDRLPESFGNVSSLQVLLMSSCSQLERLPESFGNLSSLQRLLMSSCSKLGRLCESFGNLSCLQRLYMIGCSKLEILLESFGNLSSMQTLYIGNCSMLKRLPETFGNLSSLQKLYMIDCFKLEKLPESFGNLSSLQNLDISNCSMLERLPDSFGKLSSLQILHMSNCLKLERLPESFGNLHSLQILGMSNCSMLERLPGNFGNLFSMQNLNVSNCSMLERLPESFGNLSSLQRLSMIDCSKLERLPQSFEKLSSMQNLDISKCSMLESLPESFGNLSSLQRLYMSYCFKLERLPQTFDQLNLQTLKMDGWKNMYSVSDNFWQFRCLKFLSISNCKELKRLPDDIVCLSSLAGMKAYGCVELEGKAMDRLVEIKSLMFLEMGESPMLIKRWEQIQQHRPLVGAALRFEYGKYPYEEIMSTMFFNVGSRFLHVDGEGQLAELASSSFPDVGVKLGLLLTACNLSNELRHKIQETASSEFQIIYVDVDVDGEGSSWMEERDKRIKNTLLQLPEGSCAWTSRFHKTSLLLAYSLWHFTGSANTSAFIKRRVDTWIAGTSVLMDENGRRKLSYPLEMIFRRDGCDSRRLDFSSLFSGLSEAWDSLKIDSLAKINV